MIQHSFVIIDAYSCLSSCLRIQFHSPGNDRFIEISELNADQIADSLTDERNEKATIYCQSMESNHRIDALNGSKK